MYKANPNTVNHRRARMKPRAPVKPTDEFDAFMQA
jgi:hypothetical protein